MLFRVEEIELSVTNPGTRYKIRIWYMNRGKKTGLGRFDMHGNMWAIFKLPLMKALSDIGDVEFERRGNIQRISNGLRASHTGAKAG